VKISKKRKNMVGEARPIIARPVVLISLTMLVMLERLFVFFFMKDRLLQILFLDTFLLFALLLGLLYFFSGQENIIQSIFGEITTPADGVVDIGIGLVAGFVFAFLALHPLGLSALTASLTDDPYVPLSQIGKLSEVKLTFIGDDVSPAFHLFMNAVLNFFHIAFNEEVMMALITVGLFAAFGLTLSAEALSSPFTTPILFIRGFLFALIHIFAYTNSLTSFNFGYFIPAIAGGVFFGYLLVWRGLAAAVVGHGTYNTLIDVVVFTGGLSVLLPIILSVLVVGVVLYVAYTYIVDTVLSS
jgi:hypothetical protein